MSAVVVFGGAGVSKIKARECTTVVPTRCLHFTTGCTTGCMKTACCTTGWVKYVNEPSQAALERSSHDAYDVIRLTRSKAAVWTVDDVASLIIFISPE